jgi:hypothetical protein
MSQKKMIHRRPQRSQRQNQDLFVIFCELPVFPVLPSRLWILNLVTRSPQSERHIIGSYARNGAVKRHYQYFGFWWCILGCLCDRCNCCVREFRKEQVRLKMRDGR